MDAQIFDELHVLVTTVYTDALVSGKKRSEIEEELEDCFFDFLAEAYLAGLYSPELGFPPVFSLDRELDVMYLRYGEDNKNVTERIREHVRNADLPMLLNLACSEYHRVYQTGAYDCAEQAQTEFDKRAERTPLRSKKGAKIPRKRVMKSWETMMDEKVRETHAYIQSVTIPLEDLFYTIDGDYARFPGDFKSARNNANCRCEIKYSIAQ